VGESTVRFNQCFTTINYPAIAGNRLHVTDQRTFGHFPDGQNVADEERGSASRIDVFAGVQTLSRRDGHLLAFEFDGRFVLDDTEGSTASGIVHNLLHDAFDAFVALSNVAIAHLRGALSFVSVRAEHRAVTLTLSTDHLTHL